MTITERTIPAVDALRAEHERLAVVDLALLWERTGQWEKPMLPSNGVRGGGLAEPTDVDIEDRAGDIAASRYHTEVRDLMAEGLRIAARLNRIAGIVIPKQPRQIQGKEMLDAQVAAEGWCVSCWRYDQTRKDREKNRHGHFHDREACDLCADFKRNHGIYPPLSLLQAKHGQFKNWTTKMIQTALEEHHRPKKR